MARTLTRELIKTSGKDNPGNVAVKALNHNGPVNKKTNSLLCQLQNGSAA